ncbi:MAG: hypothetical protein C0595_15130 [Marinilabiliales bacterium]|nr:MAG: hypothetical protein C0595_15130 [Marinilabiliales bacterium]
MISRTQNQLSELSSKSKSFIVKRTLLVFIPIILLVTINAIIILAVQENLELQVYKESEKSVVDTKFKNIESEIKHIINDIFIIKNNSHLIELLDNKDDKAIENISRDIFYVIKYQKSYDQIRLIDENGNEIIRVNYNNGIPEIVDTEHLQNKKHRYYFYETMKLNNGEVFVSPFDLNIENKKIETPLKPMIRFATPIFDNKGNKRGILIFNYFGQQILNQLNNLINTVVENQLMLLNSDGYWLKGTNKEEEWAFMYEDKKAMSFASRLREEWEEIKNNEASQIETDKGLFTYKTIYPVKNMFSSDSNNANSQDDVPRILSKDRHWKLVSFVDNEVLYSKQNTRRNYVLLALIIISVGFLILCWKLAVYQYKIKLTLLSLELSNETKDKFFTIIAHDLKGPFNALMGFSDILMQELESGDTTNVKTYNSLLNETIHNTYNFLINLLDWSRSQTDKIEYNPETFNVFTLVDEIKDLLHLQAEKKDISIIINVHKDLQIHADKNMINTIIRNFVSNALKYSNNYGKVTIDASLRNNRFFCSVSDNGIGMSKESVEEISNFGDIISTPGTDDEKGTGLGLLLCNELIKKHKGKLGVESVEGKGSKFSFEIPQ